MASEAFERAQKSYGFDHSAKTTQNVSRVSVVETAFRATPRPWNSHALCNPLYRPETSLILSKRRQHHLKEYELFLEGVAKKEGKPFNDAYLWGEYPELVSRLRVLLMHVVLVRNRRRQRGDESANVSGVRCGSGQTALLPIRVDQIPEPCAASAVTDLLDAKAVCRQRELTSNSVYPVLHVCSLPPSARALHFLGFVKAHEISDESARSTAANFGMRPPRLCTTLTAPLDFRLKPRRNTT